MSSTNDFSAARMHRWACLAAASIFWLAAYAGYLLSAAPMAEALGHAAATFVSSALCIGAAFISLRVLVSADFRPYHALALFAAGLALNLLAPVVFPPAVGRLATGLSLLLGGFGAGALLAGAVESPRYVVPVCVVSALADAWSVAAGPSRAIIASERAVRHVFVGMRMEDAQPLIGVADLVFVALFLCLAVRLKLGVQRSALAMYAGLALGLAVAAFTGGAPGIPFIAGAFVIAHWPQVKPGRREIIQTALFVAAMLLVFSVVR